MNADAATRTNVEARQRDLDDAIDALDAVGRLRHLFTSQDAPIYAIGLIAAVWYLLSSSRSLVGLLIPSAYADSGLFGALLEGKNYVATLIFLAFIFSLAGAIFASGPGRKASETFAKTLAGALAGFLAGTKG